jgi:hypothetical protein
LWLRLPETVDLRGATVTRRVNTYRSSTLEFEFPRSWTKEDARGLLVFGEPDGNADCVLIVGFDPDIQGDVIDATATLVRKTLQMYPDARSEGQPHAITIGRKYPAASTTWVRTTAGNGLRNRIVGVASSGGLLFFQYTYKSDAAANSVPVFERILASMRIEDVLPSPRTAVPTMSPGVNVQTPGAGTEERTPRTQQLHEMQMSVIRNVGTLDGAWAGTFTALLG